MAGDRVYSNLDHPYCLSILRRLREARGYLNEALDEMPSELAIMVHDEPTKSIVMEAEDIYTDLDEFITNLEEFYQTPKVFKGDNVAVLTYLQETNPNICEFDTAVPEQWIRDVVEVTECDRHQFLRGVVWAYGDGLGPFGKPMTISDYAWDYLRIYLQRRKNG